MSNPVTPTLFHSHQPVPDCATTRTFCCWNQSAFTCGRLFYRLMDPAIWELPPLSQPSFFFPHCFSPHLYFQPQKSTATGDSLSTATFWFIDKGRKATEFLF